MKKRFLSMALTLSLGMGLLIGCGNADVVETVNEVEPQEEIVEEVQEDESSTIEVEDVTIRVGAMSGPTAMGMVKLMDDAENNSTINTYEFAELATDASAFVSPLATGELDIACVPSNLASVVFNKTEGKVQILATCNQGVLYVVERGESVSSLSDLADKKIYMTGEGAVPEYTVRYLLKENGIDPDTDVAIQWCADTTEALSYISADENAIAILPQPFVTAACAQVEGLRVAVDLNKEWNALDNGCNIVTGVVVARKEFVEANPNATAAFVDEYKNSVDYVLSNKEEAAALIEKYGIVAKAPVAMKALDACNLVAMTGADMKTAVSGFLQILFDQNPASVGGALPTDDFYYE